ncbi:MAG: hypothetical protein PUD03_00200 [Lachnospiraceae bacterium]|nr:hypothetical protein [Lachnospiraceae bacterium]MDD5852516.1 hypothetical protein [Lachnospiraceae bacterium]
MAIGMVEFQGTIQRTQDFSVVKHNEDMKAGVEQANFQIRAEKKEDEKLNQIQQQDNSQKSENRTDPRQKGNNTYAGDGGRNRKKHDRQSDGKVIQKGISHFDMSV